MGILEDIEDVKGAAGTARSVRDFLRDAGLGNVARELEQLADQANRLRQRMAVAAASTKWSGAAADGFKARALRREAEIADLVAALDSAHSAVSAASALAGVF